MIWAKLKMLIHIIKSMVDSFTITNEQFIENNYLAKINVSFEKKVLNFYIKKYYSSYSFG